MAPHYPKCPSVHRSRFAPSPTAFHHFTASSMTLILLCSPFLHTMYILKISVSEDLSIRQACSVPSPSLLPSWSSHTVSTCPRDECIRRSARPAHHVC